MKTILKTTILPMLCLASSASAAVIVDFTAPGGNTGDNSAAGFVFTGNTTGSVTFDLTASAVIPTGGGANGGNITRLNGGLGSTVENNGAFLNFIGGAPEVLQFTVSNVSGLLANETLVVSALLSQNGGSAAADQGGGFGGTFGQQADDNLILTSDSGTMFDILQSDTGDAGAILLNNDDGNAGNTGNTFRHSANDLAFTSSFTAQIDDNADAVVIQGFEFDVVAVPEPSSTALLGLGALGFILRRRR